VTLLAKVSSSLLVTERPTPSVIEEQTPFENTQVALKETKVWSWVPVGIKMKNDCSGKGQQQFTRNLQ
jgi:hypothetical protein